MPSNPRIVKSGHCRACHRKFEADTRVIATDSASVLCETHAWFLVPEAIVFTGRYDERPKR